MKPMRLAAFIFLTGMCFASKAYAVGWTCGDKSYVRLDVLDTPTSVQVGMLYGDSLEGGQWLGDSAIALRCGSGGSSTETLLVCRSVNEKSAVMLTIYRSTKGELMAYVTAPMGQGGDVNFDLPCTL